MAVKFINKIVILSTINLCICIGLKADKTIKIDGKASTAMAEFQVADYEEPEEKWLENALRDIAYYLRNHKFNEWDRRYYSKKPAQHLIGFYSEFPTPSLKSIHWEVHKHCHKNFFKCVIYLHSVIKTAPFTRLDDITTTLNKQSIATNDTSLKSQNNECKKALLYTEKTGLPFGGPKEKFNWRTSASYYMCWYTMKELPALSMLGESCDNFANCLDPTFGNRNHDPRSNDKLSFACAMYSFCPDPCCPLKHVNNLSECYNSIMNPCYVENYKNNQILHMRCTFKRNENNNLEQIIENKWNTSCHCEQKGFTWDAQYGMCVDINECITGHYCDMQTEECLNLPGTYECVCKWGYGYDKATSKCVEQEFVLVNMDDNDKYFSVKAIFNNVWSYFA